MNDVEDRDFALSTIRKNTLSLNWMFENPISCSWSVCDQDAIIVDFKGEILDGNGCHFKPESKTISW